MSLSSEDREALGGPDGPWIRDDWDDLLTTVERIAAEAWDEGWQAGRQRVVGGQIKANPYREVES